MARILLSHGVNVSPASPTMSPDTVIKPILIVDDDPSFLTFASAVLSEGDLKYEVAISGKAAIGALRSLRFGVALVDLLLPDMDGLEVLKQTRSSGVGPPVVLISGAGSIPSAVAAMRLGAVDFLEKPVSAADLLDTVRPLLATPTTSGAASPETSDFLARATLAVGRSACDITNIAAWVQCIGTSSSVLYSRCGRAHVGAKPLLDLGRLLRVVLLPDKSKRDLLSLLDSRDTRTIDALLGRAGLTAGALMQCSSVDFLRRQQLLAHPPIIELVVRYLPPHR